MPSMNNETLYGISVLACGVIGLLIRYAFKSKCSNVNCCCGLISIQRDINNEIIEQEMEEKTNKNESKDFSMV